MYQFNNQLVLNIYVIKNRNYKIQNNGVASM